MTKAGELNGQWRVKCDCLVERHWRAKCHCMAEANVDAFPTCALAT